MRQLVIAAITAGMLFGCSRGTEPSAPEQDRPTTAKAANAAAECLPMLRYGGARYGAIGYTSKAFKKVGTAQTSRCDDTSRDARGVYFPDNGPSVAAFSLRHAPPAVAVAIREPKAGTHGVYISARISVAKAERMLIHRLGGRFDP